MFHLVYAASVGASLNWASSRVCEYVGCMYVTLVFVCVCGVCEYVFHLGFFFFFFFFFQLAS